MIRYLHFILLFPFFLCQSWIQESEMIAKLIAWKTALIIINTRIFFLFSDLFKHVQLLATVCSFTESRYKVISFSPPAFFSNLTESDGEVFHGVVTLESPLFKPLFSILVENSSNSNTLWWVTWPEHFMYSLYTKMHRHRNVHSCWRFKSPKLEGTTAGAQEYADKS